METISKERQIEILEKVKKRITPKMGMCDVLSNLCNKDITENEYYFMLDLLVKNKPNELNNVYREFTQTHYWSTLRVPLGSAYWWYPLCSDTKEIRINYINVLITNLK